MRKPRCPWNAAPTHHKPPTAAGRHEFGEQVAGLLGATHDVSSVEPLPAAFTWRDGFSGEIRMLRPDALVTRMDGSRTFVYGMGRDILTRDPELGGRRRNVEAECLARNASFEIWTELEINPPFRLLAKPATGADRAAYSSFGHRASQQVPCVVGSIAARLGLRDLLAAGSGWVGRCCLTGIPMTILSGALVQAGTGSVIWRPRDYHAGNTASVARNLRGCPAEWQEFIAPQLPISCALSAEDRT